MKQLKLTVKGLSCGGCIKKIQASLELHGEVTEVSGSLEREEIIVGGTDKLSAMQIKKNIEDLGFRVSTFVTL